MRPISPTEAARAQAALEEAEQLLQLDERATVTVEEYQGGSWVAVAGFSDIPCKWEQAKDERRRRDGLEAGLQVRTDAFDGPVPRVTTLMRATVVVDGETKGPYQILKWAPEAALGETYLMELRLTPAPRYS